MKPSDALLRNNQAIRDVILAHRARNPRVFGSVIAGKDRDGSDLDILVEPDPDMSLFDLGAIRCELQELLGISVDIVTPGALPAKFREKVLAEALPI